MARRTAVPAGPPPHPGVMIEAEILRRLAGDEIAMRRAATALDVPVDQLLGLVRGRTNITPVWALRLARVLGGSAEDWMARQAAYDLARCEAVMGGKLAALKPLEA